MLRVLGAFSVAWALTVKDRNQEAVNVLTDTKLKNLKAEEKLYKVSDRDGLYAAVSPTGTVTFRLDYRLNGWRETPTIGQYGRDGISLGRVVHSLSDSGFTTQFELEMKIEDNI